MRFRCAWLALFFGLFLAGISAGQPGDTAPPSPIVMDEDVEIMRRILDQAIRDRWASLFLDDVIITSDLTNDQYVIVRSLAAGQGGLGKVGLYDPPVDKDGKAAYSFKKTVVGGPRWTVAEGAYLKGFGVVFTMTLPSPRDDPRPRSAKAETKAVKEWERIRQQLRGEKPSPATSGDAGKNPALADILLKALAENGHNFSILPEKENLTVIVTFRKPAEPAGRFVTNVPESNVRYRALEALRHGTAIPLDGLPQAVRDNLVLGDLNTRQGRYQEAVKDYMNAAQALGNSQAALRAAPDLARRLAQAYLGTGNVKEARVWLERADKIEAQVGTITQSQPAVPARLVITASKSLLDRVASGKMSVDEFRHAATVEYRPIAATAKKTMEKSP